MGPQQASPMFKMNGSRMLFGHFGVVYLLQVRNIVMKNILSKSDLALEVAQGYGPESEIWAGFGPVGNTKKIGTDYV